MRARSRVGMAEATENIRTIVPRKARECPFGTIVRALWPVKPALNLAQRVGCTERAAQFYIDGERKPSAWAIIVLMIEILEEGESERGTSISIRPLRLHRPARERRDNAAVSARRRVGLPSH